LHLLLLHLKPAPGAPPAAPPAGGFKRPELTAEQKGSDSKIQRRSESLGGLALAYIKI